MVNRRASLERGVYSTWVIQRVFKEDSFCLIEMKCTQHKMNHFKVNDSMAFSNIHNIAQPQCL